LDLGANINLGLEGETPLLRCILEDFAEGVQFLLDHGAEVSSPSCPAAVLLLAAVLSEHTSALDILLKEGASIDAVLPTNHPSLILLQSKLPHFTFLLADDEFPGQALIHVASGLPGGIALMELVLKYGPSVDQQDETGCTALLIAASKNHVQVVELLLRHGADPKIINNKERSPLHCAAYVGTVELSKLLLEYGAEIDVQDEDLASPLHVATSIGFLPVVQLLLNQGADPNIVDCNEWTPLHLAAKKDRLELAECLITNGASVDSVNLRVGHRSILLPTRTR
jgi:ankyrin repeat protein